VLTWQGRDATRTLPTVVWITRFPRGSVGMSKERHRELFEKFCSSKYLDCDHTSRSKTVTEEKAQKIRDVLNEVERSDVSKSFKFWVTKTRKFVLLNYPEVNLKDVLCLPAKQRVRETILLFSQNYFIITE